MAGLLAFLAFTTSAQPLDGAALARIDEAIIAEAARQETVGVAVGVIREGEVVHLVCHGFEDRESERPVTTRTMFRWASVSKPLTAIAAVQLATSGDLDLDADVRTFVPEFPDKGDVITTRHLLGNLGGIVHYSNGPVIRTRRTYDEPHPFADVVTALDTFRESPLVSSPGARYSYSTHGFILASAVVQRAGEEAFAAQVRARIAAPLGMSSLRPDYQWEEIEHRATGYRRVLGRVIRSTNTDVSWKLGGGGWISNVEDFARFGAGLIGDDLLTEAEKDLLWTPQATNDGEATTYGLGFSIATEGGTLKVSHNGAQEKTRTRLVLYPERGHGVVVMTNSEYAKVGQFSTAVYRAIRDSSE